MITGATSLPPAFAPLPSKEQPQPETGHGAWDDNRMEAFLTKHGIEHKPGEAYSGGTRWQLNACPFCGNSDHCAIVTNISGKLGFSCSHNHCQGYHWRDFRNRFEPERTTRPKRYIANAAGYNLSDSGNAERLACSAGGFFRHVTGLGWLAYNPERNTWVTKDAVKAIWQCALETVRQIYAEASKQEDSEARERLAKWAIRSEAHGAIRDMLATAEKMPVFSETADNLDSDPLLLNTPSGPVYLPTGELLPPDPAQLFTKCCNVPYSKGAKCPTWLAHLDLVFRGDKSLIDFVQMAAGVSLTGLTDNHSFFILHGNGRNGKSAFLDALFYVLGSYAAEVELSSLSARRDDNAGSADLARLMGARLVKSSESREGYMLHDGLIKKLTGGGRIVARQLYRDPVEFRPQFKLWIDCNHAPRIAADYAMAERVQKIPFEVTISREQRDPDFMSKLEAEGSGILAWAIEGAAKWFAAGKKMQRPAVVERATEEYMESQDDFAAWVDEKCTIAPTAQARADQLRESYNAHTGRELSATRFGSILRAKGFTKSRETHTGATVYKGIGLYTER